MNANTTIEVSTKNSKETEKLAESLGELLKGGEVFLLSSDLGGGKTTFTKGLAKGLGSEDIVTSPTFTVSNSYDCRDDIKLHHFDFYRLNEGGMVEYELAEYIDDPKNVIVIEWGDIVDDSIPEARVTVDFKRVVTGEDDRLLTFTISSELNYLEDAIR